MYRYIRINFRILKITAILLALLSRPANSQPLTNFVDLNQSRQFFENGQKQFEREIKNFPQALNLPKIKLPQDYNKPVNQNEENLIKNENLEIKSISDLAIDRYYIYSIVRL